MSRPKFGGSSGRKETEGTFYRDIAFVPSGTLALKQSADATAETLQSTKRIKDAADVRAVSIQSSWNLNISQDQYLFYYEMIPNDTNRR